MDTPQSSPARWLRVTQDALLAIALLIVLAIVFWIDSATGTRGQNTSPTLQRAEVRTVDLPDTGSQELRLGVTPPQYDDMGDLLRALGSGFRFRTVELEDFRKGGLEEFDVIFLTCGVFPQEWLGEKVGESSRENVQTYEWDLKVLKPVSANLRAFVDGGGTLYASDLRYPMVAAAFGEFADTNGQVQGDAQEVTAEVVDAELRRQLGPTVDLHFDMPDWYAATFHAPDCEILIRGTFKAQGEEKLQKPLLVRFRHGKGTVIFTSFHNEKQSEKLEKQLLRFLVFATVTAKNQGLVTRAMIEGGFTPDRTSILSASANNRSVTDVYDCTKVGPLQFALGFPGRGALLRLTLIGPDRQRFEKEGDSPFILEIPDAAAGRWEYTITAVTVPHPNFAFTLSVGQKED